MAFPKEQKTIKIAIITKKLFARSLCPRYTSAALIGMQVFKKRVDKSARNVPYE